MRENKLAWLAVIFSTVALIGSVVVGYLGYHTHDDFLELDANDMTTDMPTEIPWDDGAGVLDGTIEWLPRDFFTGDLDLVERQSV